MLRSGKMWGRKTNTGMRSNKHRTQEVRIFKIKTKKQDYDNFRDEYTRLHKYIRFQTSVVQLLVRPYLMQYKIQACKHISHNQNKQPTTLSVWWITSSEVLWYLVRFRPTIRSSTVWLGAQTGDLFTSRHERCNLLLDEFCVTLPRGQDMPKYIRPAVWWSGGGPRVFKTLVVEKQIHAKSAGPRKCPCDDVMWRDVR